MATRMVKDDASDSRISIPGSRIPVSSRGLAWLLENLPDPVFLYRDQRAIYVNAAAVRFLEYDDPREVLGLDATTLVHPEDRDIGERREARMRATGLPEPPVVLRFVTRTGALRTAECRPTPVDMDGEFAVLVVCTDLTERLGVEVRFKQLMDSMADPVCVHRGGYPVYANAAFAQYLGYPSVEELSKHRLREVLHEKHHAEADARGLRMLETGQPAPKVEFTLRHLAGHDLVAEVSATPIDFGGERLVMIVLRDMTARRQAEEEVRRAARTFRSLIERLPVPIAIFQARRVVFANPALAELIGHPLEDVIGRNPVEIIPVEDRPEVAARLAAALESESPIPAREARVVRQDGTTRLVESTMLALEFDGVRALCIVAVDITERRAIHARLLQTDRMASIGTLAAGIAHEINNPLAYVTANIRFSAETLADVTRKVRRLERQSLPDDAEPADLPLAAHLGEVLETLDEAREGADRIRDVVQDVRTFSRPDEGETSQVDVREVLESSINMARNEIRHRARLVKDYGEVPGVDANESKLGQVFLNLLLNAAQALPVGEARDHEIRIRTYTDPLGRAVVEIHDTGPGVPHDLRERVFEPFFTTKPSGVGTGLGLAICRNIVSAVDGEIGLECPERGGSIFRVLLPPAKHVRKDVSSSAPPVLRVAERARVLVVDDEPAVARAIRRDLARQHDVTVVNGGQQALDLLLHKGATYDIVFCDLMMPDLTGMDIYARVREADGPLTQRFVFMTGGAFTPQAREFLASVENICLDKPFQPEELRELARASVTRRSDR